MVDNEAQLSAAKIHAAMFQPYRCGANILSPLADANAVQTCCRLRNAVLRPSDDHILCRNDVTSVWATTTFCVRGQPASTHAQLE